MYGESEVKKWEQWGSNSEYRRMIPLDNKQTNSAASSYWSLILLLDITITLVGTFEEKRLLVSVKREWRKMKYN